MVYVWIWSRKLRHGRFTNSKGWGIVINLIHHLLWFSYHRRSYMSRYTVDNPLIHTKRFASTYLAYIRRVKFLIRVCISWWVQVEYPHVKRPSSSTTWSLRITKEIGQAQAYAKSKKRSVLEFFSGTFYLFSLVHFITTYLLFYIF